MRTAVLLLFSVGCGLAQLTGITTTDDGSVLLFHSRMRLHGSADFDQDKIYRWDGAYSVLDRSNPVVADPTWEVQDHFGDPAMSGDGKVLAYFHDLGCDLCQIGPPVGVILKGSPVSLVLGLFFDSALFMSHNGRYLSLGAYSGTYDLTTGQQRVLSGLPQNASVFGVTDDGAVLVYGTSADGTNAILYLSDAGGSTPILQNQNSLTNAIISADGSRVVYSNAGGVWSLDMRSGQTQLLNNNGGYPAAVSADGSRAVYSIPRTPGPADQNAKVFTIADAHWVDLATGQQKPLGAIRQPMLTMSGNGEVVWLLQLDGRLAKVRLDSGGREFISGAGRLYGKEREFISEPLPGYVGRMAIRRPFRPSACTGPPKQIPNAMRGRTNSVLTTISAPSHPASMFRSRRPGLGF